jgi:hypothetical protein
MGGEGDLGWVTEINRRASLDASGPQAQRRPQLGGAGRRVRLDYAPLDRRATLFQALSHCGCTL